MRTRTFVLVGVLLALLVAGVGSYYASAHPDGLSFVAEQTGFSDQEQTSATADSPFAGYQTKGVENDRLSGGLAGVAGTVTVLVLGGVLFGLLRRRTHRQDSARDPAESQGA
ncbi:MAG TPA: PDGLE domain-containing protein [Nocardioides sp.]|uniref:PDGLE domain-containing protein n=1 Tax=Nocardioides sp. TaxID=35761 RepID=UPI002B642DA8|nr:PDGLE domain-containing protein [Nocardioides sp.]HQR26189.1 PDGLE domain-containing protein [Nocardioides sp.]